MTNDRVERCGVVVVSSLGESWGPDPPRCLEKVPTPRPITLHCGTASSATHKPDLPQTMVLRPNCCSLPPSKPRYATSLKLAYPTKPGFHNANVSARKLQQVDKSI